MIILSPPLKAPIERFMYVKRRANSSQKAGLWYQIGTFRRLFHQKGIEKEKPALRAPAYET